jgi:hypothetical protein
LPRPSAHGSDQGAYEAALIGYPTDWACAMARPWKLRNYSQHQNLPDLRSMRARGPFAQTIKGFFFTGYHFVSNGLAFVFLTFIHLIFVHRFGVQYNNTLQ